VIILYLIYQMENYRQPIFDNALFLIFIVFEDPFDFDFV